MFFRNFSDFSKHLELQAILNYLHQTQFIFDKKMENANYINYVLN